MGSQGPRRRGGGGGGLEITGGGCKRREVEAGWDSAGGCKRQSSRLSLIRSELLSSFLFLLENSTLYSWCLSGFTPEGVGCITTMSHCN